MSQTRAARARAPVTYEEPSSGDDDSDMDGDAILRAARRKPSRSQQQDDSEDGDASPAKSSRAKKTKEPKKRAAAAKDDEGWTTKISKSSKAPAAPQPRRRTKGTQSQSQETKRASEQDTEEPEEPVRPPPKKKGKEVANESKIFVNLLHEGTAVKLIVTEFLKSYRLQSKNPEKALCELTNFLIQSSGSDMLLSVSDHASMDREDLLIQIQTGTSESQSGDTYPIVSKQKAFKKFKSRFVEFFHKLVQVLYKDPDTLFDGRLLSALTDWLSVLAGSSLRSLRHTCTLATCELVNALVSVGKDEQGLKDKAERATSGKGHGSGGASGAKFSQLKKDIEQYSNHIEALEELLGVCFNNVFVHRYRDIDVSIRTLCLESLGGWLLAWPEHFLVDNYLKYAGWCLSDKATSVRLAALTAVGQVLETGDEDLISRMEGLFTRFKPRLVEMAEDVDVHVASKAIKLITLLLKYTKIMGEEDAPNIPAYIWDAEPLIRKAAVEFANEDMFSLDSADEKKDKTVRNEEDLLQFLNIYRTYCPHAKMAHETKTEAQEGNREGIECMVDGFWAYLPFLHEWELIHTRLTLAEKGSRKSKSTQMPDDNEQELLIYILLACAKKATGVDKKAAAPKGKLSKKDKDEIDQRSEVLSIFLVRNLPDLLSTFQADKGKIKALIELVRFIELEQFVALRKTQDFIDLVEVLQKIYLKQNEASVLETIACTLRHVCKSDHKLQDNADEIVRELATKLSERFKHLTDEKTELSDERKYTDLLATLTRMECLSRFMYLKQMSYDTNADRVLHKCLLEGKFEAAELLLRLCCENIFYLRANLNTSKPSKTAMKDIANFSNNFLSHIQYILSHGLDDSLKFTAFKLAADMFVVFSPGLVQKTLLSPLAIEPTAELRQLFVDYFQQVVAKKDIEVPEDEDERADYEEEQKRCQDDRETACKAACKVIIADYQRHKLLAAHLLSLMLQYGKEVDEIVKLANTNLRNMSPNICFAAQLSALQLVYSSHDQDEEDKEVILARETHLSELAKRFALTHTQFQAPAKKPSAPWVTFFQAALEWATSNGTQRFGFLETAIGPFVVRASPYDVGALHRSWRALEIKVRDAKDKILDDEGFGTQADANWAKMETFSSNLAKIASRKGVKGTGRPLAMIEDDDSKSVASHATGRSDFSVHGEDELDHKHSEDISLRLSMSPIQATTNRKRNASSHSAQADDKEESEEEEEKKEKSAKKGKRSKSDETPSSQASSGSSKGGKRSKKSQDESPTDYEALSQEHDQPRSSRRSRGG